jgi:hypothetical protein
MATTRVELDLNTDMSAKRFPIWISLSVFSAVCLAAVTTTVDKADRDSGDKWVLAVMCISMSLSFVAVGMYLLSRSMFVGQAAEAGMVSARTVRRHRRHSFIHSFDLVFLFSVLRNVILRASAEAVAHTSVAILTDFSLDCLLGRWFARHYEPQQCNGRCW